MQYRSTIVDGSCRSEAGRHVNVQCLDIVESPNAHQSSGTCGTLDRRRLQSRTARPWATAYCIMMQQRARFVARNPVT